MRAIERDLALEGGALTNGISKCPYKRGLGELASLCSLPYEITGRRSHAFKPRSEFSSDTRSASTLSLDFSARRTITNKYLLLMLLTQ